MNSIECPYCKYIFEHIDSDYLGKHQDLPYEYTLNIFPLGKYTIKTIKDIEFLCDFFINSISSTVFQEGIFHKYRYNVDSIYYSKKSMLDESTKEFLTKTKWNISNKQVISSCSLIDFNVFNNIPFIKNTTLRFNQFYWSASFFNQEYTNILIKEDNYSNLFTFLFNVLILINSCTKENTPIDLVYEKPDISKIRNWYIDNNKNENTTNIVFNVKVLDEKELQIFDANKIMDFRKSLDSIGSQIRFYKNSITRNYTQCLLLLTNYYAEYLGLYS